MPALYRQYRPTKFSDISGQAHIVDTLKHAITSEQVAHAYLFYGPRGTGKTTTARILARRLNCQAATDAEPCGSCSMCQATAGQSLDIIEIDAASNRGIDDIRALQDALTLRPAMGKYKVYIIDEVHMLTKEAFTALLKTLEEPLAHIVFILATTEFHKVPETIISRCQVYRFRRATTAELQERLRWLLKQEKRKVSDDALDYIIARSDGCYRDAESLLGQVLTLHAKTITREQVAEFLGLPSDQVLDTFLTALVRGEAIDAVQALDTVFAQGFDSDQFTQEAIRVAREGALHIIAGQSDTWQFTKEKDALARSPHIIRALVQALQDLAYVPEPLIALHLAVLTLCAAPTSPAVPQHQSLGARSQQPRPSAATVTTITPAVVQSSASDTLTTPQAEGTPELERVTKVWPQVIQAVRNANPVAATFLRAMEPISVAGDQVRIKASYALHRNFFDKDVNRHIIEAALQTVLGTSVRVSCFLDESATPSAMPKQRSVQQQEAELLQAVKEVFG